MVNIRLFLYFFRKENIFNILFFSSLASLLFLGDIFFLVLLIRLIGPYLAFTLFFLFTAMGQIGIFRTFAVLIETIQDVKERGGDCMPCYLAYAGTLPSVFYMIYPGILSTIIGFILLIPPLRKKVGKVISHFFELDWDEVNEYLFLLV
jgi:UPF0716 family protein affecting phage T7 exclusion